MEEQSQAVKEYWERYRKKRADQAAKNKALTKQILPEREAKNKIHPDLWYVVYEENLLKPKIFKYGFISEYFAWKLTKIELIGKRVNVLKGIVLLSFGITHCRLRAWEVSKIRKTANHKYNFPIELGWDRKKTLRNLYRRRMRRVLIKLLESNK